MQKSSKKSMTIKYIGDNKIKGDRDKDLVISYSVKVSTKNEANIAMGMAMKTVGWCNC